MQSTPLHSKEQPRRLEVRWLEESCGWGRVMVRSAATGGAEAELRDSWAGGLGRSARTRRARECPPYLPQPGRLRWRLPRSSGFTVIEMLVVVAIIGFLAAMALPHLTGMTTANTMTLATQQLVGDAGLARQLAITHRTTVYMVFASPGLTAYPAPVNEQTAYNTVSNHQYSSYALVSLRSVGDQPGAPNPQYLTPWKTLPDGVFIATSKFNTKVLTVTTANTLSGTTNVFFVGNFANVPSFTAAGNLISFPFPATDAINTAGQISTIPLPYVAFTSSGQLASLPFDEFIPLAHGSVFNFPTGAQATESPSGNSTNNATLIHIDALTGRAKIERNQF